MGGYPSVVKILKCSVGGAIDPAQPLVSAECRMMASRKYAQAPMVHAEAAFVGRLSSISVMAFTWLKVASRSALSRLQTFCLRDLLHASTPAMKFDPIDRS